VKVTTDLRPGIAVDFELVRDVSLAWVRLPNLTKLHEEAVRRAHRHALSEAFVAQGPARLDIDRRVIGPIEAELRRRGLEVDYAAMDHAQGVGPAPDVDCEAECEADEVHLISPRQSELTNLDEAGLRRLHALVMRAVFNTNGPSRMGLGVGVLQPIEAEMRRRGLEADYWSMEHKQRSDAALLSELN
jgi:hypothetical protein